MERLTLLTDGRSHVTECVLVDAGQASGGPNRKPLQEHAQGDAGFVQVDPNPSQRAEWHLLVGEGFAAVHAVLQLTAIPILAVLLVI